MPWSSFGENNDCGIVLCHDIRVSAALVQNGLSYLVPEGVTRKRGLRTGSLLPLMREEDAWDFFWSQARHASGMDVVWNTLTWVNEKGETVFDPSAAGEEAECQRKEIDRFERDRDVSVRQGLGKSASLDGDVGSVGALSIGASYPL